MSRKVLYREYDNEGNLIKKECSNCGEIKIIDNFYKRKDSKDGIYGQCKQCMSKNKKKYYLNNKEKINKNNREYQRENREKIREYLHQYEIDNKDKIREYNHQYNINNREKRSQYAKKYSKQNKEKLVEYHLQYYKINKDKINERHRQYYESNKDKIYKTHCQYYENNIDKIKEYQKEYNINNKDKIHDYQQKFYKDKINQEIMKIYENFTKNNYPNNDIQYGIIYGVHCISSNKWYIGQTITSFNLRYNGDFFNHKTIELSNDSIKGKLLQDDIEKYGQENFEIFEVLDVAFSEKELDEKEAYYIDYYKAYDEGYNSNRGNIFKHNKSKRKEVI